MARPSRASAARRPRRQATELNPRHLRPTGGCRAPSPSRAGSDLAASTACSRCRRPLVAAKWAPLWDTAYGQLAATGVAPRPFSEFAATLLSAAPPPRSSSFERAGVQQYVGVLRDAADAGDAERARLAAPLGSLLLLEEGEGVRAHGRLAWCAAADAPEELRRVRRRGVGGAGGAWRYENVEVAADCPVESFVRRFASSATCSTPPTPAACSTRASRGAPFWSRPRVWSAVHLLPLAATLDEAAAGGAAALGMSDQLAITYEPLGGKRLSTSHR